jgi:molybdopterin synthase sulfur carrier subunit
MAKVVLTRGLTQYTGGERELELDADNIRQLLRALGERYPSLAPHLKDGVAVAIDGEIFQDAWLEPVPPDSEVHIIPQIVGG